MALHYKDAAFLLMELTLAFLFLYVLFAAVMHVDVFGEAPLTLSEDPVHYAVLALAALTFLGVQRTATKHAPQSKAWKEETQKLILDTARKKVRAGMDDPRIPAILVIELGYVMVIALAIDAYVDPEKELLAWSQLGLGPPVTTALNFVLFVLVTAAVWFLYNYTKSFRIERKHAA